VSYPHLNNFKSTFIEWIETNDLYFKVAIKSHLSVDIFTECCLSCCRTTSHSDDYLLWRLLDQTFLSLLVNLCVHFSSPRYYMFKGELCQTYHQFCKKRIDWLQCWKSTSKYSKNHFCLFRTLRSAVLLFILLRPLAKDVFLRLIWSFYLSIWWRLTDF